MSETKTTVCEPVSFVLFPLPLQWLKPPPAQKRERERDAKAALDGEMGQNLLVLMKAPWEVPVQYQRCLASYEWHMAVFYLPSVPS